VPWTYDPVDSMKFWITNDLNDLNNIGKEYNIPENFEILFH
jgi:hypothetical protein